MELAEKRVIECKQDQYDHIRLRDPFVSLRGTSWSAMGRVACQTKYSGMRYTDTWKKLHDYPRFDFIRSLFDPILKLSLF